MNSKIYNNHLNLIAKTDYVPVVSRGVNQQHQTAMPAEAYDDYGVMSLYPSFNLSIILIVIGVIVAIAQVLFFAGMFFTLITGRKKYIKCKACGSRNEIIDGKAPIRCVYCNSPIGNLHNKL